MQHHRQKTGTKMTRAKKNTKANMESHTLTSSKNHDKEMMHRILKGVGLGVGVGAIGRVIYSAKKTTEDPSKEPSFGNSSNRSANRCWQNSILQTLRCSETFKTYISQRYPTQHILYKSFVSKLPYHASEMTQVISDLFGPTQFVAVSDKLNVVGDLEAYFFNQFLKLVRLGYPFEPEFKRRMNGNYWFNLYGGSGFAVDMVYLLSVIFNDLISFDFVTPIIDGEPLLEAGDYRNYRPGAKPQKAIHFKYNNPNGDRVIPDNTFSLVCEITYGQLNTESKTASAITVIPNAIMSFFNPILAVIPMLQYPVVSANHIFSICRIGHSKDYYDNDTMYFYTNEHVIKGEQVQTYMRNIDEYMNILMHPIKNAIDKLKLYEKPIVLFCVVNNTDTFNHIIQQHPEDPTRENIQTSPYIYFKSPKPSSRRFILYSKSQTLVPGVDIPIYLNIDNDLYKKNENNEYVFISNCDVTE